MSDLHAILYAMEAAHPTIETDAVTPDASLAGYAAPRLELPPLTRAELETWFRGGEPEADACEHLLAWAARARGGLDLAIGEGLDAIRHGDRLAELGYHLDDYAREVLDLGKRTAENLARLGRPVRHLRCIHGGFLAVFGRAPDRLIWLLGRTVWKGPTVRSAGAELLAS